MTPEEQQAIDNDFQFRWFSHTEVNGERQQFDLNVGWRGYEHIVPPAGEEYAFDVMTWARRVTVAVSPTGRSVRVWVDGTEVKLSQPDGTMPA